jgi:hypothetical protein
VLELNENVGFEVFTAVTEEFRLLECYAVWLLLQPTFSEERVASIIRVTVTHNVIPSSPILINLMMKAILSSEMSVLIRAARRNIQKTPSSSVLQSENLDLLVYLLIKKLFLITSVITF